MLYQAIRPKTFDEVIGNSSTVGALRSMLRKPAAKRPHTILLHGPPGCGKTSLAFLLAEAFGAVDPDMDIIKLNAANTNGIDTAREIAAELNLPSFGGNPKVYIIDESHQLRNDTQEALLEATEFTPEHCYFIWCTTDKSKVIPAMLTRATKYEVTKLGRRDITKILEAGVKELGHEVDPDLLEAIPLVCEGIPREALVMLEQVAAMDDVDAALDMLEAGTAADKTVLDLMKHMIMNADVRAQKWRRILTIYDNIEGDSERTRRSLQTFLYNKLKKEERQEKALDILFILETIAENTYYGGKAQLGTMIARACIKTPG